MESSAQVQEFGAEWFWGVVLALSKRGQLLWITIIMALHGLIREFVPRSKFWYLIIFWMIPYQTYLPSLQSLARFAQDFNLYPADSGNTLGILNDWFFILCHRNNAEFGVLTWRYKKVFSFYKNKFYFFYVNSQSMPDQYYDTLVFVKS